VPSHFRTRERTPMPRRDLRHRMRLFRFMHRSASRNDIITMSIRQARYVVRERSHFYFSCNDAQYFSSMSRSRRASVDLKTAVALYIFCSSLVRIINNDTVKYGKRRNMGIFIKSFNKQVPCCLLANKSYVFYQTFLSNNCHYKLLTCDCNLLYQRDSLIGLFKCA